jgi:hypothetical protein
MVSPKILMNIIGQNLKDLISQTVIQIRHITFF